MGNEEQYLPVRWLAVGLNDYGHIIEFALYYELDNAIDGAGQFKDTIDAYIIPLVNSIATNPHEMMKFWFNPSNIKTKATLRRHIRRERVVEWLEENWGKEN